MKPERNFDSNRAASNDSQRPFRRFDELDLTDRTKHFGEDEDRPLVLTGARGLYVNTPGNLKVRGSDARPGDEYATFNDVQVGRFDGEVAAIHPDTTVTNVVVLY